MTGRKPRSARRLNATAVHEAGHAVIGRVLGMELGEVTIEADHDSSGHAIFGDPCDTWEAWQKRGRYRSVSTVLVGRIIASLAGALAEIEVIGSTAPRACFRISAETMMTMCVDYHGKPAAWFAGTAAP